MFFFRFRFLSWDYFLMAQVARQGIVSPMSYTVVLQNKNEQLPPAKFQLLTTGVEL